MVDRWAPRWGLRDFRYEVRVTLSDQVAALARQVAELTAIVKGQARVVTVQEAARAMNVSVKTVRRRISSREWPHVRVGRAVRVDLGQILQTDPR